MPITASPTANPVTPGPTSVTTPAPSAPNCAAPGYIPSATNTSRKFTPTAATATRSSPAANSTRGHGWTTRSSSVPPLPAANRHSPAGNSNNEPDPTGANRALYTMPLRTTNWGSPQPITDSTSSEPSESTKITRPGCSACADRTNPHTAAPAKSMTSSPAKPTAPRVSTTSTPVPAPASDDCTTRNASAVAACTESTTPVSPAANSHTAAPSILSPLNETGDQVTPKSPPP